MEALYIKPLEEAGLMTEEEEEEKSGEQDAERMEAFTPMGSTTEDETDEDSEPEPPPVVRRKVSFADAFGLDLVSVKEFDTAEVTGAEVSWPDDGLVAHSTEEFHLSCLFAVPSSSEELDQRLQTQMMELESIEILPGTTTLRGIIRVVNLCYSKKVFARISLDRWSSHFDLLAEYVPGSSDRRTDRFTFSYILVPPVDKEGSRVEFCLCYETSVGTFWVNNNEMNYVLFCHQKGQMKEHVTQTQEESCSYKSKRSCLKANRYGSGEEKTKETFNTSRVSAEVHKAGREILDSALMQALLPYKEHKPWGESVKGKRGATRLAHEQYGLSKSRHQLPKAFPHDTANAQKASQHLPSPWGDSASSLYKCQEKKLSESAGVLTYHQIPLLTLDWNNDAPQQRGTAHVDDILTGRAKLTLSKSAEKNAPSVNDMWGTFPETTNDVVYKEISVSDVWQVFLNGPSCKDQSDVPESEWLQTAVSVSPSNDTGPQSQHSARSQEFQEFQVGRDTPTTLQSHTLATCQLQSDTCEAMSATATFNAEDHQAAEACDSSPRDDNTYPQDASQRSQTNSETDTPQEFSLKRTPPVSEDFVDSPTECHNHADWEQGKERIIGTAEGMGRDEPFTLHTAHLVTSSGELETTDMTAMPKSQNASAVDRISQAARQDEGLSSKGEGEVTGTAHNAMDDTLAFRDTIRQETKDATSFAFSTPRPGLEEELTMNYTQKKAPTGKDIFRPRKTKECDISPKNRDETQCRKSGLNQNSEIQLQKSDGYGNDMETLQSSVDGLDPKQTCEENLQKNKTIEAEANEGVSNIQKVEVSEKTKISCKTSREALIDEGMETINQERQQNNNSFRQIANTADRQTGNTALNLEACDDQSRAIQGEEELCVQESEVLALTGPEQIGELKSDTGEQVVLNPMGEGKSLSSDGKAMERQEINPSAHIRATLESMELNRASQGKHITVRPDPKVKCNPKPLEVVKQRQIDLEQELKGQKDDACRKTVPIERTVLENVGKRDTLTECQPETSEGEEDTSIEEEKLSVGKLKIEAMRELIGNAESPQGERKNPMKEEELSAEVESPPHVEHEKLSDGRNDPIRAESIALLEVIEPELERRFIERFGEDLVKKILEEVFIQVVQASSRHTNTVDEMGNRLTNTTQDFHLPYEKYFSDTFDLEEFSLTETPDVSNVSLFQGEQTLVTEIKEHSVKDKRQPLSTTEQTHVLYELQANLESSAHLCQNLASTLTDHSEQSESARSISSPEDQENHSQIKAICQETASHIQDSVNPQREGFDQASHRSQKHLNPSSEKLEESDAHLWWTMLYTISHITRLPICTLLVSGFVVLVVLYDFPAFFSFYIFSVCCWIFKWKRQQMTMDKEKVN